MEKFIIPLGGVIAGSGLMTMLFGWEVEGADGKDMSQVPHIVGFSGVDELTINGAGTIAFLLIGTGVALMIYGNARAWMETNGY